MNSAGVSSRRCPSTRPAGPAWLGHGPSRPGGQATLQPVTMDGDVTVHVKLPPCVCDEHAVGHLRSALHLLCSSSASLPSGSWPLGVVRGINF